MAFGQTYIWTSGTSLFFVIQILNLGKLLRILNVHLHKYYLKYQDVIVMRFQYSGLFVVWPGTKVLLYWDNKIKKNEFNYIILIALAAIFY